jgi:hypothetical protein
MMITTRQEAKAAGAVRYFTGIECKKGHVSERHTANGACIACLGREKRTDQRKQAIEQGKSRYFTGKPCLRGHIAERHTSTKTCVECMEEHNTTHQDAKRTFAKDNPHQRAAAVAKYRASKLRATPAWADHERIAAIYKQASRLRMHVDHIIPLQSRLACGLHVHYNLQLLTASENTSKQNKFDPDTFVP